MQQIDTIIIGAGPGGYELAAMLARKGEQVALIERDQLGGTCLNRGCIPTKCLCATAHRADAVREAMDFGVFTHSTPLVDYAVARQRAENVVAQLRDGVRQTLRNVAIIEGEARIVDNHTVAVADTHLSAPRIVIASGSAPARLKVSGGELALTSDEFLALESVPKKIVIIGGGVIGVEFAGILASMGCEVTVIEYCKEILPSFDPDVAKRLRTYLSKRGINFLTAAAVKEITTSDASYNVIYEDKKGTTSISADLVICATGRRPVVPKGTAEIGVSLDNHGFIVTDENMRTSVEGVYAIGDVNGKSMLAHSATAQAKVIAHSDPEYFDAAKVPSVVFSTPELAAVGLSETQLKAAGTAYKVEKRQFAALGKACADGTPEGFAKFLLDPDGNLLGATILGAHASDLIIEPTLLLGKPFATHTIHPHPTLSEISVTD